MSVRERRNRKDVRGKTADQLWRGRCSICTEKIRRGEATKPAARGSGRAHLTCPESWPLRL